MKTGGMTIVGNSWLLQPVAVDDDASAVAFAALKADACAAAARLDAHPATRRMATLMAQHPEALSVELCFLYRARFGPATEGDLCMAILAVRAIRERQRQIEALARQEPPPTSARITSGPPKGAPVGT
jgi:hypothetical protein